MRESTPNQNFEPMNYSRKLPILRFQHPRCAACAPLQSCYLLEQVLEHQHILWLYAVLEMFRQARRAGGATIPLYEGAQLADQDLRLHDHVPTGRRV